jgi:hypothetical protein
MEKIEKYCLPNWESHCIQCRCFVARKRVCPIFRVMKRQRAAEVGKARKEFREFLKAVAKAV